MREKTEIREMTQDVGRKDQEKRKRLRRIIVSEGHKCKKCSGLLNCTHLFLTSNCPAQPFSKGKKKVAVVSQFFPEL